MRSHIERYTNVDFSVPVPTTDRPSRYPLGRLEIGQSFLLSKEDDKRGRVAACQYKFRHPGWNYRTRQEAGGTRVWRTA